MIIKENLGLLRSEVVKLRSVCDSFLTDSTELLNHIDDLNTAAKLRYRDKIVASLVGINSGYNRIATVNSATEELASDLLPPLIVPAVVGMSNADATTAITSLGFVAPLEVSRPNGVANEVVRIYPEAGTSMARSTVIQLFVSTGTP